MQVSGRAVPIRYDRARPLACFVNAADGTKRREPAKRICQLSWSAVHQMEMERLDLEQCLQPYRRMEARIAVKDRSTP